MMVFITFNLRYDAEYWEIKQAYVEKKLVK